jgi:hypothetical protein
MHCLLSPVSPRNHHCGGLGRPHGIFRTALLGTRALQHLPPHSSPSTGPWPGHHVLVSSGPPLLQPCRVTSLVQTHRGFVELSNCGATAEKPARDWGVSRIGVVARGFGTGFHANLGSGFLDGRSRPQSTAEKQGIPGQWMDNGTLTGSTGDALVSNVGPWAGARRQYSIGTTSI